MLMFDFDKKLYTTTELLTEIGLSLGWLDLHKSKWRKKGNDCWDMGLRLIGKKAFWDPIIFSEWLFNHQITNKPKYVTEREEQTKMIAFIKRNTQNEH